MPGQLVYLLFHYLGFCVSLSKIFFPSKAIKNNHLKVFNVCIPMHLKRVSQLEERVEAEITCPGTRRENWNRYIEPSECRQRLKGTVPSRLRDAVLKTGPWAWLTLGSLTGTPKHASMSPVGATNVRGYTCTMGYHLPHNTGVS